MRYSDERRAAVLKKLQAPYNRTIREVAAEENLSVATIYNWRQKAREAGRLLPEASDDPEGWSSLDKFHAVLETASLSEHEITEYCRQRGLYPEQLRRWRAWCEQANARGQTAKQQESESLKAERKRIRELERELLRKDRALAETAALLTLRKKAAAIWGDEES